MEMLFILGVIALGVLVLHFFTRPRARKVDDVVGRARARGQARVRDRDIPSAAFTIKLPPREPGLSSSSGSRSGDDELLRACYHDKALADRLVEHERKRAPGITPAEARSRALERLYRDRAS